VSERCTHTAPFALSGVLLMSPLRGWVIDEARVKIAGETPRGRAQPTPKFLVFSPKI
jgi:hypothetical protein